MKQERLDLYDNNFNKLDKTIIRRVDEIYTRLMEDPSYSGVKERWQKALEEMSGMVATMQVEMEAANSTTDQTGVKRGGKVSN